MNYKQEIEEWCQQVACWCGDNARLLHVSSYSSDIRIYAREARIFKIRRMTPASVHDRSNSLEDEQQILGQLGGRGLRDVVFPTVRSYRRDGEWECLELTEVEPPLTTDPVAHPMRETFGGLFRLALGTWRLNRIGISHGDLEPGNAGTNCDGDLVLLDFDQATFAHRVRCILRDFLGAPAGGRACRCSVLERFGRHPLFAPITRLQRGVRRRIGGGQNSARGPWGALERARARGDRGLIAMAEAWEAAATSGANHPGGMVAYYSLDVEGIHFPGERPWWQRWDAIARAVDFRGKRMVELGCNMGLLSIHAVLAGASRSIGLDASPGVVKAAGLAAMAFGVDAQFAVADFDRDSDWEERAGTGDIATALSLTYWLKDKDRLWRYLARFDEVLFEGHESAAQTHATFTKLGYGEVREVGLSERKRMVFHARRLP